MRFSILFTLVLTLFAFNPGTASAALPIAGPIDTETGSWSAFIGMGGDLDQLLLCYCPELDTGGGRFKTPFADTFTYDLFGLGPTATGWGVTFATPYVLDVRGPAVYPSYSSIMMRQHFTGDVALRTGFMFAGYRSGALMGAWELERGEHSDGFLTMRFVGEPEFTEHYERMLAVPEPATLSILGLAIAGCAVARRRCRV